MRLNNKVSGLIMKIIVSTHIFKEIMKIYLTVKLAIYILIDALFAIMAIKERINIILTEFVNVTININLKLIYFKKTRQDHELIQFT